MLHIVLILEKFYAHFWIRPKPVAKLQTQRPTKVHVYYREKLNALLYDLQKME